MSDSKSEARESEREFELTYHALIQEIPPDAKQIRIWIPLARTEANQRILDRKIVASSPYQIFQEPRYGNEILHLFLKPPLPQKIDVAITYHVTVEERRNPLQETPFQRRLHLGSGQWMVVDERIQGLSKEVTQGKVFPLEQGRAIYDYVLSHMQYDKTTPGWGNGDTARACLVGKGNCTDFHSLFISLARASKIPSRFKIGIPIPEQESEGKIPGYHCWAEFYVDGKGWISVDASEAWKYPEKREYYFGTYDANRLLISTGRNIQLVPKQKGEPVNIFFYPYVELDGKPFQRVETEFQFRDVHAKQKEV
ncbi:MAG: transglutaminase domain-containing protein [Candidatus Omnitrophica bacterium]|nr:transglutaminase domain-containing protein [Candidatus Omnitrophota bacterium]